MAKKKKKFKAKKEEPKQRSPFIPMAFGVLLFILALFVLLGGFGIGGPLPEKLFDGAFQGFGWAAYLVPLALCYWAYYKFSRDNDHRIPLSRKVSMFAFMILLASALHTVFAEKDAVSGVVTGGAGGAVGAAIGNVMLQFVDAMPATVVFFILTLFAYFWAFNTHPKDAWDRMMNKIFRRGETEEVDGVAALKAKAFTINDSLAETPEEKPKESPRLASFRNSMKPMSQAEKEKGALTAASDPNWQFPSLDLLNQKVDKPDAGNVTAKAESIKETFANFSIDVEMEGANIGPRVTQYTLRPPSNVKLTKMTALETNLALDLEATTIRMEAPIPGKKLVGIEVPNKTPATVRISSVLQSKNWQELKSPLGFAIGRDIAGSAVVGDLTKMPHLLVAGQTGSGKSVMINTILTSLLYRNSPSDLKLILVDPKQVELKPYDDMPHLLTPVITEPEKCISALKWAVAEMERRYKALADARRRNITEYNAAKPVENMPYIVIVIDELADLMMMAARDVESLVVRIAQKARAVGIHLVLATQRPSVDVITGLIKANVPARIAFTTASQVDSRTIIDQIGAEKLLGQGDMLLLTSEMPKPVRVQGALITDNETNKVTDFLRAQQAPNYDDEIISQPVQLNGKGGIVADLGDGTDDDMFKDAVRCVIEGKKASTSLLQRRLRIGYGRAARLIETMEEQGIVGSADGNRPREVLVRSLDEVFGGDPGADDGLPEPQPARLIDG